MKVFLGNAAKVRNKSVEIPLTSGVTWIFGDSSIGKTYLFDCIRKMGSFDGRPVVAINLDNSDMIMHIDKFNNSVLLVIDQFDEIRFRYPACVSLLNKVIAPVIIFGRTAEGVRVPIFNIFELKFENKELYLLRLIGNEKMKN